MAIFDLPILLANAFNLIAVAAFGTFLSLVWRDRDDRFFTTVRLVLYVLAVMSFLSVHLVTDTQVFMASVAYWIGYVGIAISMFQLARAKH